MYARADMIQIASSESTSTKSPRPHGRGINPRGQIIRFLNWFGSGGVATHELKASQGHGSNFMLINGQIVITPSCREATGADSYMM